MTSVVAGLTSVVAGVTSVVAGVTSVLAGVTSGVAGVTSAVAGVTSAIAKSGASPSAIPGPGLRWRKKKNDRAATYISPLAGGILIIKDP